MKIFLKEGKDLKARRNCNFAIAKIGNQDFLPEGISAHEFLDCRGLFLGDGSSGLFGGTGVGVFRFQGSHRVVPLLLLLLLLRLLLLANQAAGGAIVTGVFLVERMA